MSIKETNKTIAYLTYGALMALGPTLGGYFIGSAIENSKGFDRKVNVKGLSERFIDSDQATFSLKTGHRGDNLNDLYSKIENDKLNILEFLHNLGFEDKSISFSAPKVTDREKSWGGIKDDEKRYLLTGEVRVKTNNVQAVKKAIINTGDLIKKGVPIEVSAFYEISNKRFQEIKPEMVAEATKNARVTAKQFAKDSGTEVGAIIAAHQGGFSIEGTKIEDNYNHLFSLTKKVRVVTQVTFVLK